jgi:hypothetical protein
MGKLLTILGIDEAKQKRLPNDVFQAEMVIDGLQNVYASSPESYKKNQLALAISESIRLLMARVQPYLVEEKKEEEIKKEEKKLPEEPKQRMPQKGDIVLPTGTYSDEWFVSKVDEEYVAITKLPNSTVKFTIQEFLKFYKWDEKVNRWFIQIKEEKPKEKPEKEQKKKKEEPKQPEPQTPHKAVEDLESCDEIKDAIKGLNLLAKLGDDEAKEIVKQLKNKLKTQKCK